MTLVNGQLANQSTFNNAFVSRTNDTSTEGKLTLENVDSNTITDVQAYVNKIASADGILSETDTTDTTYISNNYITVGADRKTAIGELDTAISGVQSNLETHEARTDNPHNTTPSQIGAYTIAETNTAISTAITNLIDGAPAALDTLNELAAALADDANFAGTVTTALSGKEPTITAGTSSQYYRGDKTFQTLDATAVGLGNVTNDAQLKRAAGDINTFTEKLTVAADDLVLIEDSADTFNKKKVKMSNMGGGSGSGVAPWATATAYTTNQVVTYNNKLWRCWQSHTSPATFETSFETYWFLLESTDNLMTIGESFESGTSSGWQSGTISGYTAGTFPTTAVSSLTDAIVTGSSPITGFYSLGFPATSAGSALISPAITLDSSVSGKNLSFSFDHKFVSGIGSTNVSGTSANTFHVVLYDVTNSKYIQPTNTYGITAAQGTWFGTAQPDSNCISIKFVILIANTVGASPVPRFDNFCISRKIAPTGLSGFDFRTYVAGSPTNVTVGNGTVTSRYAKVGDVAKIKYQLVAGSTTSIGGLAQFQSALPPGVAVDTSKLSTQNFAVIGKGHFYDTSASTHFTGNVRFDSGGQIYLAIQGLNVVTTGVPVTMATGDTIDLDFEIPVLGWSSNVQLSNSAGNSQSVFVGYKTSTQAVTANVTDLAYTAQKDSSGSWNGTQLVAREPGDYFLSVGGSSSANTTIKVYVNGVVYKELTDFNATFNTSASVIVYGVLAGQTISLRSSASVNINAGGANATSTLTIYKLANPQTIAASDSVSIRYTQSSGQSIPDNTVTVVTFGNKVWDSHGAYNPATGIFTAPMPGEYEINSSITFSSSAWPINKYAVLFARKNSSVYAVSPDHITQVAQTMYYYPVPIKTKVKLLAGETLDIAAQHNRGAATSIYAFSQNNWIEISRTGNY